MEYPNAPAQSPIMPTPSLSGVVGAAASGIEDMAKFFKSESTRQQLIKDIQANAPYVKLRGDETVEQLAQGLQNLNKVNLVYDKAKAAGTVLGNENTVYNAAFQSSPAAADNLASMIQKSMELADKKKANEQNMGAMRKASEAPGGLPEKATSLLGNPDFTGEAPQQSVDILKMTAVKAPKEDPLLELKKADLEARIAKNKKANAESDWKKAKGQQEIFIAVNKLVLEAENVKKAEDTKLQNIQKAISEQKAFMSQIDAGEAPEDKNKNPITRESVHNTLETLLQEQTEQAKEVQKAQADANRIRKVTGQHIEAGAPGGIFPAVAENTTASDLATGTSGGVGNGKAAKKPKYQIQILPPVKP